MLEYVRMIIHRLKELNLPLMGQEHAHIVLCDVDMNLITEMKDLFEIFVLSVSILGYKSSLHLESGKFLNVLCSHETFFVTET